MIQEQRVLAIIPARGGSKGLPGKNIRPLREKPLIAWSIDAARQSRYVDEIIVSTDSPQIAEVAVHHGARVEIRPEHLASDSALVADTIRHLIQTLHADGENFGLIVLLQPTSPIRPERLIDECLEAMELATADSIATFSAIEVPPERLWIIEDSKPRLLIEAGNPWLPRQALSKTYHLNGLVYVFKTEAFMKSDSPSVLVGRCIAKETDEYVDIDTLDDFTLAEQLAERAANARASE